MVNSKMENQRDLHHLFHMYLFNTNIADQYVNKFVQKEVSCLLLI